jgi:hypothetical protein
VTSPNRGETWLNASIQTITWTQNYGTQETLDVSFCPPVPATNATHGSFTWTASNFGDGDSSDTTFTIAQSRRGGR